MFAISFHTDKHGQSRTNIPSATLRTPARSRHTPQQATSRRSEPQASILVVLAVISVHQLRGSLPQLLVLVRLQPLQDRDAVVLLHSLHSAGDLSQHEFREAEAQVDAFDAGVLE